MTTDKEREAFERAEAHLQWLKESVFDEQDLARIVGYERCLREWQAATAEADAKYLPVIERLVAALEECESWREGSYSHKRALFLRDEALALAKPLLEKKEEV